MGINYLGLKHIKHMTLALGYTDMI